MALTATIGTSYDLQHGFVWPDGALTVSVRPVICEIGGQRFVYTGATAQAVAPSTVNYVYLDLAGNLQIAAAYPIQRHFRLARVTTGVGSITQVDDDRAFVSVEKDWVRDNHDPDAYPTTPSAWDDEFEGSGAIDAKWTLTDPGGTVSMNQTDYPGMLHVTGLDELGGVDTYAQLIRFTQAMPTDDSTWSVRAKVAIINQGCGANAGEFASVCLFVGRDSTSDLVSSNAGYSDGSGTPLAQIANAWSSGAFAATSLAINQNFSAGQWAYLRLDKTTANVTTLANTYAMYFSMEGRIWFQLGSHSKTFGAVADQFGILFRRPKSQTQTPLAEALIDWYRFTYV